MSVTVRRPRPTRTKPLKAGGRRGRRWIQRGHRWVALATGLLLLVVVMSGVALVLDPEIDQWLHGELYRSTETEHPLSAQGAVAVLKSERPNIVPEDVIWNRGHWEVYFDEYTRQAHIDPGTGELNGIGTHDTGVMGFLKNLHMCALSCPEYPGYIGFLEKPAHVLGNEELTVGGLILAVAGVMLLALCLSGLVLWWPGIKRFARGLRVRKRKGRYAFNYDLHKVAGFAVLPLLAMWAITGAGFELKQVEDAWYGLLPGDKPPEYVGLESKPGGGGSVSQSEALQIASAKLPGYEMTSVSVPDAETKTSAYSVWMSPGSGIDPTAHAQWAGTTEVAVDRYSGRAEVTWGAPDRELSRWVWEDWQYYGHAGYFMGGPLRTLWIVLGLTPLLLAVTGITTWLMRRRKRRAKAAPA